MSLTARIIDAHSLPALQTMVADAGVHHVYAASQLAEPNYLGQPIVNFLGCFDQDAYGRDTLVSALMLGANLVPINTTAQSRRVLVQALRPQRYLPASLVGNTAEVLDLWHHLEQIYGQPREVRARQPLLLIQEQSTLQCDERVRYSRHEDLDVLFPACVDMFTEELGVSPIAYGQASYRSRVESLVHARHSFVRRDGDTVIFKAEVSAVGNGIALVQGVWVNPDYRGQGIAAPALATVVKFILGDIASAACLYVNNFNTRALAAYRKVGFHQVDEFATILL